jgi:hypothetical protein
MCLTLGPSCPPCELPFFPEHTALEQGIRAGAWKHERGVKVVDQLLVVQQPEHALLI